MPPANSINVNAMTRKINVDNRIPLCNYYRIADNLLKEASIYREERNIIDLYIILLRYSSLVCETIPFHQDYRALYPKERSSYKKKLLSALDELESLRPELRRQLGELEKVHAGNVQEMFKSFWGSQEEQAQPHPQEIPTESRYPPSVVSLPSSSRPSMSGSSASSGFSLQSNADRPHALSQVSPAEAAGIIALLKDKSVDELRKLLSDKDAYRNLFLSLDLVKTQNKLRDELRNGTLQLTRENLEKEPQMMELRNQCRIIRTTELATAMEKLNELERQKGETLKFYAPASLLHRLQEAMNKTDEESEIVHRQLLDREIDLATFVQKYKKLRSTYHRRALTHLAAKTSLNG